MSVNQGWINDFIIGNYNEYKSKRTLYWFYTDCKLCIDPKLLEIMNYNEWVQIMLKYEPFERYVYDNDVLKIDGKSFMKYNECNMYYVDDKLIFVKKDLEECYPDIFGKNCIDLYFHSLKVFPYVNDFDTININLMK